MSFNPKRSSIHGWANPVSGKPQEDDRKYFGIPLLSKATNILWFFLREERTGNFLAFFMKYIPYQGTTAETYYRRGLVVTAASQESRPLIVQSFVMLKNPNEEKMAAYNPGLLSLQGKYMTIDKDKLDQLLKTDDELEKVWEKLQPIIADLPMCKISENLLREYANFHNLLSERELEKAITKLKGASNSPNRLFYFGNEEISRPFHKIELRTR